jgi:hypothetical protein
VSAFQKRFRIMSASERRVLGLKGDVTETDLKWQRLELADRANLAFAVLREGNAEDHCLVAFYLLATNREREARDHLDKGGDGAGAVEAAFGIAARGVQAEEDAESGQATEYVYRAPPPERAPPRDAPSKSAPPRPRPMPALLSSTGKRKRASSKVTSPERKSSSRRSLRSTPISPLP